MAKPKIKNPEANGGENLKAPSMFKDGDTNDRHPAFCFRQTQYGFRWSDCDDQDRNGFCGRIETLSQMNWQTMYNTVKNTAIEKIPQEAFLKQLPPKTPGDRVFYSARGNGKARIIGYREGKVFHVVWLDRKGEMYDHGS